MENRQSVDGDAHEWARLTFLLDASHKAKFEALCASQEADCSKVLRMLIEEHLRRNGRLATR